MSHISRTPSPQLAYLNSRAALPVLAHWAVLFAVTVTKWKSRHRSRQQLRKLDENQLCDIGVKRRDADLEATLPFWKP